MKYYKKTNKNCLFRTDSNSLKLREDYYNSEEFLSREMLDTVYQKLKNNRLEIRIPKSYVALKNKVTKEVRVEIEHKVEKVIKIEKGEIKFRNKELPYIPHLIFYTEDQSEVYCEISVKQSKSISKYYDIWKENNKTILEIKKVEVKSLFPSNYLFEDDLSLTYLYDPILDKARSHKLLAAKRLADEQKSKQMEIEATQKKLKSSNFKKYKRELRKEIVAIVETYMDELVEQKKVKVDRDSVPYWYNGGKVEFKNVMIEKMKLKLV